MNVDLRFKWDPAADGRIPSQGDIVEAWIQYNCPDAAEFVCKVGRVGADGNVEYQTVTRTDWNQVRSYFQNQHDVVMPAQPSCPGY